MDHLRRKFMQSIASVAAGVWVAGHCSKAKADTIEQTTWHYPEFTSSPNQGVGEIWLDHANIKATDGARAHIESLGKWAETGYLYGWKFNFTGIPLNATITGVHFWGTVYSDNYRVCDSHITLFHGGNATYGPEGIYPPFNFGENRGPGFHWSPVGTELLLGGDADLWGLSGLTPSNINTPLGVMLQGVNNGKNGPWCQVEEFRLKVVYTVPAG